MWKCWTLPLESEARGLGDDAAMFLKSVELILMAVKTTPERPERRPQRCWVATSLQI